MNQDPLKRIKEIEEDMVKPDFWNDKEKAQSALKELNELKEKAKEKNKFDSGGAIITFFAGAGGDDAEDFTRILFDMYAAFIEKRGWSYKTIDANQNSQGGYRSLTIEVVGSGVFGILKNESGVHRLVRMSPFNSKGLRHTSFAMVEVIPIFEKSNQIVLKEDELKIEFSRAGGPGGQNVNKRETAVRVVHIPTNLSAHVTSERSQEQNKEKAIDILKGKIYLKQLEDQKRLVEGLSVSKTVDVEWGSQIRSYVLHPYKLVKDHRTDIETSDVEGVLKGNIDLFL